MNFVWTWSQVEMGPFKHTVDDGLDVRKAAFECMYTLLDSCLEGLDVLQFLDRSTSWATYSIYLHPQTITGIVKGKYDLGVRQKKKKKKVFTVIFKAQRLHIMSDMKLLWTRHFHN